ncbi:cysteine proteinase [Lactarius tabidus]
MGPPRSHRRGPKPVLPLRSRTTRSSKGKLLSDPDANTQQLTEQLRQLGLYAADTTGDGNCLFRALSDQLYGTESRHIQLRKDICDWIQSHSLRYAPFVDDERGLDVHLSLMRQPATYGGHLELSAFAHMKKCNVKVIQPGLVYLIEWAAGWDPVTAANDNPTSSSSSLATTLVEREPMANDRSRRAARRESKRAERDKARADKPTTDDEDIVHKDNVTPTVYVAYHDWEHFSSIRNLRGPHSGLPDVSELPADASPHDLPSVPKPSSKPASKARQRAASTSASKLPPVPVSAPKPLSRPRRTSRSLRQSGSSATVIPVVAPPTPADIPLPSSRSASPPAPSLPPGLYTREREQRSPKRSFDESSGSSDVSAASTSAAKRTRRGTVRGLAAVVQNGDADMDADADAEADVDADVDDADTPALSETASLSPISSPSPSPSPPPVPATAAPRRLTKRERKAAGLPRPRGSAGKIVIPGGRFRVGDDGKGEGEGHRADVQGEWARNGTGRVDVRGFRELRI